jgi:hypothetical protein
VIVNQKLKRNGQQPDLFAQTSEPAALTGEARQRMLPLIGALLREAASQVKEVDHEDHA